LASATWLAWQAGHASVARGYFGTDTRVHSLLVGVVLGALLVGRPPRSGPAARLAALAALVAVPFLLVTFALADEEDGWLPRGGFLLVAVAVAVVIAASERSWWLAGALSWRPVVALGLISYGVYLWHWPVLVVLDAERTGLDGVALFAVRLAVTLAAAVLSFVLVERPIRLGALGRSYGRRALLVAPVAAAVVVVALVAATVLPERPSSADEVAEARREQEASRPTVTVPAGPVPVTLFGDSVAHTLAGAGVEPAFQPETWTPAMDPFDPAAVDLAVATRPGCSFLPGEMRIPDGNGGTNAVDLTTRCTGWEAGVDLVLASNPDGFLVVALANDATDRVVDGRDVALDGREGRDLVADLLDDLRAMARSHGSDLALVALPPRLQRWAITGPGPDDQDARMRAVYEAYAEDHDDVVVLDLYDVLCPDADCGRPAAGFDPAWRYDGLHFTTDGAVWVANWLASELGGAAAERAGQTSGQG
jgi:lysophospholipase L1-like esterase